MQKKILQLFLLSVIVLVGCCKKKQIIPTLIIEYQEIEEGTTLVLKSYVSKDSFVISQPYLVDEVPFKYVLPFHNHFSYYVIGVFESDSIMQNKLFSDSISDISFELRGRCDQKLKKLSYKYNGVVRSDRRIER